MTRVGNSGPECKNLIKKAVGGMGSGLVGLNMQGTLAGKLFTISKNYLTRQGQSLQSQQGPRCQNIRIKNMLNAVILDKSFYLLGASVSSSMKWGNNGLLLGLNEITFAKYLEQCLIHWKHSISVNPSSSLVSTLKVFFLKKNGDFRRIPLSQGQE